jgi:tight adherence protein B
MRSFRLALEAAGVSRFSPLQVVISVMAAVVAVGSWIQLSFEIPGLTIFSVLAAVGLGFEALRLRAKRRSDQLGRLWPEVLDSLHSAARSGFGIVDSIDQVAATGPAGVRSTFREFVERIDSGMGLDTSLDWLKAQFGQLQADRLVELIRIVHRSGGAGYLDSLREQALRSRSEFALWGEIESKQGWVSGTAKLAIISPWVIVAILAARAENVAIYNTPEGTGVLVAGLLVSIIAYRLVTLMGSLSRPSRVLTK